MGGIEGGFFKGNGSQGLLFGRIFWQPVSIHKILKGSSILRHCLGQGLAMNLGSFDQRPHFNSTAAYFFLPTVNRPTIAASAATSHAGIRCCTTPARCRLA